MGLDINGTRFVLYAKHLGVDFSRSAMIGRQLLSRLTPSDLKRSLREFGFAFNDGDIVRIFNENAGYAEPLLRFLGAEVIHSFDASHYEGATHLHDMNQDIPPCVKGQYSMVFDGGTLEHIFNFPTAIGNCMEMLCRGGWYLGVSPANNFMGHGFYQFSPELYFSVFTEGNGYRLTRMVALEDRPWARWFSVRNPSSVSARVTLTNKAPTYLFVLAQKLKEVPVFAFAPQQSDYVRVWEQTGGGGTILPKVARRSPLGSTVAGLVPYPIKRWLRREWRWRSGFDPKYFELLDPTSAQGKFIGRNARPGQRENTDVGC